MDMLQLETQQISIRMPKYLVQAIDKERKNYNVSRSQAVIGALRKIYNDDNVNINPNRKLKPSNLENWPETGRTPQEIFDDLTLAIKDIKAGKADGRPIEELIAELEAEELENEAPNL